MVGRKIHKARTMQIIWRPKAGIFSLVESVVNKMSYKCKTNPEDSTQCTHQASPLSVYWLGSSYLPPERVRISKFTNSMIERIRNTIFATQWML
jgi:hypothetical protein